MTFAFSRLYLYVTSTYIYIYDQMRTTQVITIKYNYEYNIEKDIKIFFTIDSVYYSSNVVRHRMQNISVRWKGVKVINSNVRRSLCSIVWNVLLKNQYVYTNRMKRLDL